MDDILKSDLDRKIEISKSILDKLDSGAPLSELLSHSRLLATLFGDMSMAALIDCFIHGLDAIPYQKAPFTDPAYREAAEKYMELCSMEDVNKLEPEDVIRSWGKDKTPIKDYVSNISVYKMENLQPPQEIKPSLDREMIILIFRVRRYQDHIKSILITIRAYLYDYVSKKWLETIKEKVRVELLGPDYRLLINKLQELETPVGNELMAAIDNLSSTNPAQISLCALGCRNVVIKLGTNLFKTDTDTYTTKSGKALDVKKNMEKNRLHAYIDFASRQATPEIQLILEEANKLVKPIFDIGSKGKGEISRFEAQELVQKTFKLIDLLNQATHFEPCI